MVVPLYALIESETAAFSAVTLKGNFESKRMIFVVLPFSVISTISAVKCPETSRLNSAAKAFNMSSFSRAK